MYIYTYIHTYLYIYLYIYIWIYTVYMFGLSIFKSSGNASTLCLFSDDLLVSFFYIV